MIDDKLGKDEKDYRVDSTSQAFIWPIDNNEIGPLKDQSVVWAGAREWSVTGLKMQMLVAKVVWSMFIQSLLNRGCQYSL